MWLCDWLSVRCGKHSGSVFAWNIEEPDEEPKGTPTKLAQRYGTYMLYAFVNVVVLYVLSQETVDNEEVEKAKDILSHMVSELKPTGPKAPTILITDTGPEKPKDAMLTVEIPKISVSSEEEVFSSQQSHEGSKRPSSLVAVVRPMQASASGSTKSGLSSGEEEIFTLDTLPSPNDIQRSGSIVGEPQLPVPTEFRDMQDSDDEEVNNVF